MKKHTLLFYFFAISCLINYSSLKANACSVKTIIKHENGKSIISYDRGKTWNAYITRLEKTTSNGVKSASFDRGITWFQENAIDNIQPNARYNKTSESIIVSDLPKNSNNDNVIQLYDIEGKQIFTLNNVNIFGNTFQATALNNGIYFLKITSTDSSLFYKLIVD